ncbi:MAG: HNH endonuclease [Spirirestis rafaelensis WJT71-NPBG6]|jgi:5-methylcytosine-specific restriction endonuclease McrA|nr:HNH endonuclease [Spirirestis rafaelensis WJT71-NPBG6]
MPIYRERYADDWDEIALAIKAAAHWRCRHCGQQCLRPGEKSKELSRSEWTVLTLSVHHANFTPEDNRPENLIPLCSPCHLALHSRARGRTNTTQGQLELPLWTN